ncbi:MAG TPA: hypothetical protein VHB77_06475 [Planctomycetaceae bacterium]|nr:hypothetical protein [Planctomycetaceae bacterium]
MSGDYRIAGRTAACAVVVLASLAMSLRADEAAVNRPGVAVVRNKDAQPTGIEATHLSQAALAKLAAGQESDEAFARVLALYVVDDEAIGDRPPVAGAYSIDGTTLGFTPRYLLRPGVRYRAVLHPEVLSDPTAKPAKPIVHEFAVAAADAPPTTVTNVYPSAPTLPENQLRFYVHFSAPMGRGEAYEHVQLLDLFGKPVDLPFLELGEELWDPRCQRLTLIIDPGRIKRGVKPREDQGPVLLNGGTYTLVLDPKWRDATGRPLAGEFRKRFKVGAPEQEAIEPKDWKWTRPVAQSTEPLVVKFPAPLDHAQLGHALVVQDAEGAAVPGRIEIGDRERLWSFHPEHAWKSGRYTLAVESALEDLAGNRIGRAFEVDNPEPVQKGERPEWVRLPFQIAE